MCLVVVHPRKSIAALASLGARKGREERVSPCAEYTVGVGPRIVNRGGSGPIWIAELEWHWREDWTPVPHWELAAIRYHRDYVAPTVRGTATILDPAVGAEVLQEFWWHPPVWRKASELRVNC